MKVKQFILLTISIALSIESGNADDNGSDSELQEIFSNTYAYFQKNLEKLEDCNPEATNKTLKFLSLKDLKKDGLTEEETGGFKVDCSLRKIDLTKLRKFLWSKNYFQNLGSFHMINEQDANLKLACSSNPKDDESYLWVVAGAGESDQNSENDDEFKKKRHTGPSLNVAPPLGYRYFRKYTCFSTAKKCSHEFYVVTRPYPKLDFPLQALEGGEFNFRCSISSCSTIGCKIKGKDNEPNPQNPYSMQWRVPHKIFKNDNYLNSTKENYNCTDETGDEVENPVYLKISNEKGDKITNNWDAELLDASAKAAEKDKKLDSVLSIHFTIRNPSKEKHRGNYECFVIDKNGIPSTPTRNTLVKRFSGKGKLHVRTMIMTIIPCAIILGILFLMLIIWIAYRKHDKMEYDDGSPYVEQDRVAPAAEEISPQETAQETASDKT